MENENRFSVVTSDLSEAIEAVSQVYCPHEVSIRGAERSMYSSLQVLTGGVQPIVSLRYSAPVRIDAGDFSNLMLAMGCTNGRAAARQGSASSKWAAGQTVLLSPGHHTQLDFDGQFAQRSVRLDIARLEDQCAAYLNRPLDGSLRFDLQPFSPLLELAWAQVVAMVLEFESSGAPLPEASAVRLDEYMLSLVLHLHPHTYSDALRKPHALATPRAVREAEHMMLTAPPGTRLTVGMIARAVGVSIRSLEAGFREWRQLTPTQCYRKIRLEAARAELQSGNASATVTNVALHHGFPHLSRFAASYRAMFGENPGATLMRARRSHY